MNSILFMYKGTALNAPFALDLIENVLSHSNNTSTHTQLPFPLPFQSHRLSSRSGVRYTKRYTSSRFPDKSRVHVHTQKKPLAWHFAGLHTVTAVSSPTAHV